MKISFLSLQRVVRFLVITASFVSAAASFADPIVEWNRAMTSYSESLPPPGMPPFAESRIYAMTHIAVLNAISSQATNYSLKAAVAQSAHDVLVNQLPDGSDKFDSLLQNQLAAIPPGDAKKEGRQLGAAAAAEMLAARMNDGSATAEGPYTPGTHPGDYQFTPPFDGPPFNGYAAVPKWGKVTPFVMGNVLNFRAPPPYDIHDLEYSSISSRSKRSDHRTAQRAARTGLTWHSFGTRTHRSLGTASRVC